ncbi:undecaprenyl/decaprenyl-phosphate alpha-N-acetylglucosaminyl 1-phosphate transferase [Auraticoccus sp. F435]|uniref:Undecaprenyl/decaprenyl-phosphate alpha-N-acetylglucosaminyl 1-phosphate transferase n=1 Tax=Auraticoccus cholistanensis TaxID=2656650 RepID=A0A6A9UTQ1_9ACTN|nr:MraY family glycosyltransferase [Auraticoccus cholistanensis]MVA76051.1 undecaprenyl/decaprenyl-phosphate alpha-N-acetylglucosaminyl 1-phosphate transferase [Auraticoccus cholistanensis]
MREYLLVLLVAAGATYLLSGLCRRVALRLGAVARVRDRDVHVVPIPYFGGVAMVAGVAAAFLVAARLPFLGSQPLVTHDAAYVLLAALVICGVGVLDDLFEMSALVKLAGQVLAAGIVVINGVRMMWIPLPDRIISLDDITSIAITVFFIVLCTNAVNFVDGLDGLATGVVAIGALAFFTYCYTLTRDQDLVRATTSGLIAVAIAGVCLGFLPHNWFPAQMFMGDSGSMLLGLLLATSTISLTGQFDFAQLENGPGGGGVLPAYLPLVLPVAILALPLLDVVLAWTRRTIAGRWWFVPDKQHLHHRLLQRGHSHRGAVALLYLWSALISFGVVAVGLSRSPFVLLGVVVLTLLAVVLTVVRPLPRDRGAAPRPGVG